MEDHRDEINASEIGITTFILNLFRLGAVFGTSSVHHGDKSITRTQVGDFQPVNEA